MRVHRKTQGGQQQLEIRGEKIEVLEKAQNPKIGRDTDDERQFPLLFLFGSVNGEPAKIVDDGGYQNQR